MKVEWNNDRQNQGDQGRNKNQNALTSQKHINNQTWRNKYYKEL